MTSRGHDHETVTGIFVVQSAGGAAHYAQVVGPNEVLFERLENEVVGQ